LAKIIISFYSGFYIDSRWQIGGYYEAFINELKRLGNQVLVIISSDFVFPPWNGNNVLKSGIDRKKLKTRIQNFDPDLIIAFNNSTLKELDAWTECPFVLWDADSWVYFCDKERIKKNKDRYIYFSYSSYGYQEYCKELSPKKENVFIVKSATALSNRKLPKKNNITFIGSFFDCHPTITKLIRDEPDLVKNILSIPKEDHGEYLDLFDEKIIKKYELNKGMFRGLYGGSIRNQTVSAIAPLGLKLFGTLSWLQIAPFSIEALRSFDFRVVYNIKQLNHIYNTSKVAINISHSQNITGYPWRVLDIMASSACLVSDYKPDFDTDFHPKVDIPFYKTPFEAYQACKELLEDEPRRLDIVQQSNEAIISGGFTWENRIKEIGEICGISLHNKEHIGHIEVLNPSDYCNQSIRLSNHIWYGLFNMTPSWIMSFLLLINDRTSLIGKLIPTDVKAELHYLLIKKNILPEKYMESDLPIYEVEES